MKTLKNITLALAATVALSASVSASTLPSESNTVSIVDLTKQTLESNIAKTITSSPVSISKYKEISPDVFFVNMTIEGDSNSRKLILNKDISFFAFAKDLTVIDTSSKSPIDLEISRPMSDKELSLLEKTPHVTLGSGPKELVVFLSTTCGWCHKFAKEYVEKGLKDDYTLTIVLKGLDKNTKMSGDEVITKLNKDHGSGWGDSVKDGLHEVSELMESLKVGGTPTAIFKNTSRPLTNWFSLFNEK
jgi:protein-disulfide isomerase